MKAKSTDPAQEVVARMLKLLGDGAMPCPFCETVNEHLFPYEDGPRLELYEGLRGD